MTIKLMEVYWKRQTMRLRSIPDQPPLIVQDCSIVKMKHYESVEETESARSESDDWVMPVRRRAELVAVLSWRLVCSCMILVMMLDGMIDKSKVKLTSDKRT